MPGIPSSEHILSISLIIDSFQNQRACVTSRETPTPSSGNLCGNVFGRFREDRQGSILQNLVLAEKISDKLPPPKHRILIYLWVVSFKAF
jgi:hypothetical protein